MRIFYDFEFHEDGRTIDPISVGMVADRAPDWGSDGDADELYLINIDADWNRISAHPWLAANVLPHLPGRWVDSVGHTTYDGTARVWRPDQTHPAMRTRSELRLEVQAWLAERSSFGAERRLGRRPTLDDAGRRDDLELWAHYGAYDHVALCQLWGRMIDLPGFVPMWTNDLCQLAAASGVTGQQLETLVPRVSGGAEHHALADARWNRHAYGVLSTLLVFEDEPAAEDPGYPAQ
jgi:hypothetical protein